MARPFARPLDLTWVDDAFRKRFWSKVDIRSYDECWEWTAARKPSGYGQFVISKGYHQNASRVAVAMMTPLPAGVVVCHSCDNPPCVNPAHLFTGTQSDNGLDCIAKGRGNRAAGERHPSARLTAEEVAYIRAQDVSRYGRRAELAREFGVNHTTICSVIDGTNWRDGDS